MSDTPASQPTEDEQSERYVGARRVPLDPYDTRESTEQQVPDQPKPHDPAKAWTTGEREDEQPES